MTKFYASYADNDGAFEYPFEIESEETAIKELDGNEDFLAHVRAAINDFKGKVRKGFNLENFFVMQYEERLNETDEAERIALKVFGFDDFPALIDGRSIFFTPEERKSGAKPKHNKDDYLLVAVLPGNLILRSARLLDKDGKQVPTEQSFMGIKYCTELPAPLELKDIAVHDKARISQTEVDGKYYVQVSGYVSVEIEAAILSSLGKKAHPIAQAQIEEHNQDYTKQEARQLSRMINYLQGEYSKVRAGNEELDRRIPADGFELRYVKEGKVVKVNLATACPGIDKRQKQLFEPDLTRIQKVLSDAAKIRENKVGLGIKRSDPLSPNVIS